MRHKVFLKVKPASDWALASGERSCAPGGRRWSPKKTDQRFSHWAERNPGQRSGRVVCQLPLKPEQCSGKWDGAREWGWGGLVKDPVL